MERIGIVVRKVVVDSNVFVKWFVPEDYHEDVARLRDDCIYGRVEVYAPSFAVVEFCNALRKYVERGYLDREKALRIQSLFFEIGAKLVPIDRDLAKEALKYGVEHHVSVYDACYTVLARRLGCSFYTVDEKLLSIVGRVEPLAKHVKDYPHQLDS